MKLDNMFKKTRLSSGRKNYISLSAAEAGSSGRASKCTKCGSHFCRGWEKGLLYLSKNAEDISVSTHTAA